MKEEMFDDSYYDEDFNEDWDPGKDEEDDYSYDPEGVEDNIEWMENIEDPDLLEDFNMDDLDDEYDFDDLDDLDDDLNYDA